MICRTFQQNKPNVIYILQLFTHPDFESLDSQVRKERQKKQPTTIDFYYHPTTSQNEPNLADIPNRHSDGKINM